MDVASKEFLSTFEWKKLRLQALFLHGSRCQCCGMTPALGAVLNVDHIKPRKTHPELALRLDNLQVLCGDCNHGKGNWSTEDFRPQVGYFYHERRQVAHIWDGKDTFCRMWSTGGIARSKVGFARHDGPGTRRICKQCMNSRGSP